jgi:hypothetical protein
VLAAVPLSAIAGDQPHPRQLLIEDAYELRNTIEDTHPDPYVNGGGKIAFHRRFHELLGKIPEDGMTTTDFLGLVQPFVAAIGDSHTAALKATGEATSLTLPLGFKIVEEQLVVDRVARQEQAPMLGARLVAMEGVPLAELIARQGRLRGFENRYGKMAIMILRTLTTRQGLVQLVPEWKGGETIRVDLRPADGTKVQVDLELLSEPPGDWVTPPSRISMPSLADSDVAYTFLDPERTTALLVISDLMRYREACELWFAEGLDQADSMTRAAYDHFHESSAPESRAELLAGIPPATSTVAELVDEMQAAGTTNLIVDLRGNTGGNSAMREILVYLLFGNQAMLSLDNGYQIVKMSRLLFEQYSSYSLDHINEGRPSPLRATDYDFSEEEAYRAIHGRQASPGGERTGEPHLAGAPSFWEVYETGRFHEPRWSPERLLVLSSPTTFSSGFNVLTGLYSLGASVVGTPSAQPANNFGDMLVFQLQHTSIQVAVSHKQNVTFPDDPELGRCLRPQHPLTFDKLAAYDFDPNSEILLALEVLQQ